MRAERWAPVAGLTLLALVLRVYRLDSPLWYDEIVTVVESIRAPFGRILTEFPGTNHHPLYALLGRLSMRLGGEHVWSVRLPAAVFGVLGVPALYLLARRTAGRLEAFWAALLLAVSYHHIWFSQNARGYTILLVAVVVSTIILCDALREPRGPAWSGWLSFALVTALGAYTHLTMVLVAVAQAFVVLVHLAATGDMRRAWRGPALAFGLAAVLTLMLYTPMLAGIRAFFDRPTEGVQIATAGWAVQEALRGLRIGYSTAAAVVVGGVLFLAGCWSYARRSPTLVGLLLCPGVALLGTAITLQQPIRPRFFFCLFAFAVLIVTRGGMVAARRVGSALPAALGGRRARTTPALIPGLGIVLSSAVSLAALPHGYDTPKQDFGAALRAVERRADPADAIVMAGEGAVFPFTRYYERPWRRLTGVADLHELQMQSGTVWVLYTFRAYLETFEPALIAEIDTQCAIAETIEATVGDGAIVIARCGG